MRKTRNQSFEKAYPGDGSTVLSSIGKCGGAGRTGDPAKIREARMNHYKLMAKIAPARAHHYCELMASLT
jgi:hypothetical protein